MSCILPKCSRPGIKFLLQGCDLGISQIPYLHNFAFIKQNDTETACCAHKNPALAVTCCQIPTRTCNCNLRISAKSNVHCEQNLNSTAAKEWRWKEKCGLGPLEVKQCVRTMSGFKNDLDSRCNIQDKHQNHQILR